MPKFRFLLLDAGIIIGAHELGVWDHLTQQCEVTVTGTVKVEADFWYDERGEGHDIDLDIDIEAGRLIRIVINSRAACTQHARLNGDYSRVSSRAVYCYR